MGKRSRRERREHQVRRAVDQQDPEALLALAESNPELAAQQLVAAFASPAPPAEGVKRIEALAITVAARLRRSGQLKAARRLAAAGAHRSARLRTEQALVAFALGDDAEAAQLADADPEVSAVLRPLLDAARGVVPAAAPRSAPAPLRALYTAARSVSAAVRGEPGAARTSLKRVAQGQGQSVLAAELDDALALPLCAGVGDNGVGDTRKRLAPAPARSLFTAAVQRLAASPALRVAPGVRDVLFLTVADVDADLALEAGRRMGLDGGAVHAVRTRAAARTLATNGARDRATLELVRLLGADAFDVHNNARATACLYEGFACLEIDPARAAQAFDQAIALGGDLIEALRGKLQLALSGAGTVCPDCGQRHDGTDPRPAAIAADHLARALARSIHLASAAAPLAAAAALIAAEAWRADGNLQAARASLEVARAHAAGALALQVDTLEARVLSKDQPERARALLDRILAERPDDLDAWRMKIALAKRLGDRELAEATLLQAAGATHDPALAAEARGVLWGRGAIDPFSGLVPGLTTAGALAAELCHAARGVNGVRSPIAAFVSAPSGARSLGAAFLPGLSDVQRRVVALRGALEPPAQLAFDVACVALAVELDGDAAGRARLVQAVRTWWSAPASLMKLAAASWLFDIEEALVDAAHAASPDEAAGPALSALSEAALAAGDARTAQRLVKIAETRGARGEVTRLRRLVDALERSNRSARARGLDPFADVAPIAGLTARSPEIAGRELDALLSPEFSLLSDHGLPAQGRDPEGDAGGYSGALLALLASLGFPSASLDRIPETERAQFERRAREIIESGPTPRATRQLEEAARQLFGDLATARFSFGPPGRKAGRGNGNGNERPRRHP